MTNNDILRRVRYIFDLSDSKMIAIFGLADHTVTRAEVSDWLKRDEDPAFQACGDAVLLGFLDGFIIDRRGARTTPAPMTAPESAPHLNNNLVLIKLKVALALRSEDLSDIMGRSDLKISKHELSALFRKPTHKHFRQCGDQLLRNFFRGLKATYRTGPAPTTSR